MNKNDIVFSPFMHFRTFITVTSNERKKYLLRKPARSVVGI